MSASLVGSEMCIRDSSTPRFCKSSARMASLPDRPLACEQKVTRESCRTCLLYTSDAADDM
eukprot:4657639-Alexandrium_andersonii.AAC.1